MTFSDALNILTQLSREAIEFHNGLKPFPLSESALKVRMVEQAEAERVLARCVQAANNFLACVPEKHNRHFMEKMIFTIIANHDDEVEFGELYHKLHLDGDSEPLRKLLDQLEQCNQICRDGDKIRRVRL